MESSNVTEEFSRSAIAFDKDNKVAKVTAAKSSAKNCSLHHRTSGASKESQNMVMNVQIEETNDTTPTKKQRNFQ